MSYSTVAPSSGASSDANTLTGNNFQSIAPVAPFTVGPYNGVNIKRLDSKTVCMEGTITVPSNVLTSGDDLICNIPVGFRPDANGAPAVVNISNNIQSPFSDSSVLHLYYLTDGDLFITGCDNVSGAGQIGFSCIYDSTL